MCICVCLIALPSFRLLVSVWKSPKVLQPCAGAQKAVIQRREDYVQRYTAKLAQEASSIDSETEVCYYSRN